MRPKIVAGNWKLHGSHAFAQALVAQVAAGLPLPGVSVIILPPLLYLSDLAQRFKGEGLAFGAQNVSHHDKGAYTGKFRRRWWLMSVLITLWLGILNVRSITMRTVSWWRVNLLLL